MARFLCRAPRALDSLYRRSTMYEAGLFNRAGQCVAVLAYDAKRTKRALLLAIYDYGPDVASMAGVDANDCEVAWKADRFTIGASGYSVRWTGHTERDRASMALQGVA